MNALKRTLAAMAVVAASFLPAIGQAETYNDGTYTWSYTVSDGKATIEYGNGLLQRAIDPVPVGAVVIPSKLGGWTVTKVGYGAFANIANLSVEIPDSVVEVSSGAFAGCTIRQMKLGAGITSVDGIASWFLAAPAFPNGGVSFEDATPLSGTNGVAKGTFINKKVYWLWRAPVSGSVVFSTKGSNGDTTLSICDSAREEIVYNDDYYEDYSARVEFDAEAGQEYFIVVGRYESSGITLTWSYGEVETPLPIESIDFGPGVARIPYGVFAGNETLRSVKFGANVRDIYEFSFADCPNLAEIDLNEGLLHIGYRAFGTSADDEEEMVYNFKLTGVDIPSTVTYIEDEIFLGCTHLTEITGGEGVVECDSDPFGWNVPAFSRAEFGPDGKTPLPFKIHKLGKVVLGFQGVCPDHLTAADFGDVLTIVDSAFDADYGPSVTNLVSLALPDAVQTIRRYAFNGASNLTSIDFGGNASQLTIGESAFYGVAIKELKGEFRRLDGRAFAHCPNLGTVVISGGDPKGGGSPFGAELFAGCSALTNVSLKFQSASSWGNIFRGCDALKTVAIDAPDIPNGFFSDSSNLVSVALSERVASIGQFAFQNCRSLKNVVFDGNAPATGLNMYYGTPADLTSFVRRGSVGWAGPKVGGLPEAWPVGDGSPRPIAYREDVPTLTYDVTFDLGEHGMRTGGGALKQTVVGGEAAVALEVVAESGWEFYGWSADLMSVCRSATIRALYRREDAYDAGTYSLVTTNGKAVCTWGISIDGSGATISSFDIDISKGKVEVAVPSEFGGWPVRAIGSGVFEGLSQVSSVVLPKGLERIEDRAFNGCSIRSIVVPETVTYIGRWAFCLSGKGGSMSIWYEGDRPETSAPESPYLGMGCSYVREEKLGWDLSAGKWLDWPIRSWTIYPETGHAVTFDLGAHGTCIGGDLEQLVVEGGDAVPPTVQADEGFTFYGWSWPFTRVTETTTIKALYCKDGQPVDWYDVGGGCVIDLTEYMEEGEWGDVYRYWDVEGGDLVTPYQSELGVNLGLNFPQRGILTFEYKVESSESGVYPLYEVDRDDSHLGIWGFDDQPYSDQDPGWRTGAFVISEPGLRVANIDAEFYGWTPVRLHLRNFKWQDMPEYVTVTLDPKLGKLPEGQSAELRLRPGDTFGELPVPTRESCEFYCWYCVQYGEWFDVGPDTPVPFCDMTLIADWDTGDMPLEPVVNPNGELSNLSFVGDWWVGAEKEEPFETNPLGYWIANDSAWRECACCDYAVSPGSTAEVFSATFEGSGILNFSSLDGLMYSWDENDNWVERSFTLLVDGEPVEPFLGQYGSWILVKENGDHRLSIRFENGWDDEAYACLNLGAITFGPPPPPEPPVVEPVVTNTITYLGLEGAVNANPATFTTNDLPLVLGPVEREGWRFLGWTPWDGVIPAGTASNVTFTANWEEIVVPPPPPPVESSLEEFKLQQKMLVIGGEIAGPPPWSENVSAAIESVLAAVDAAVDEKGVLDAVAAGREQIEAARLKDAENPDLGGSVPGCDLVWEFAEHTLRIDGNGAMPALTRETAPWSNSVDKVESVVLGGGVTAVCAGLFSSGLSAPAKSVFFGADGCTVPLAAFVGADGTATNGEAVVMFLRDGKYAAPQYWTDGDRAYASYADALAEGCEAVVPAFTARSETTEEAVETAPAVIMEQVVALDAAGKPTVVDVATANVNTNDVPAAERVVATAVEGLDRVAVAFAAKGTGVTSVRLTVDAVSADVADEARQEAHALLVQGMAATLDDAAGLEVRFAEIVLSVNGEPVADAGGLIAITIPFGTRSRKDFTVSRFHEGAVQPFRRIGDDADIADCTFRVGDGAITIWTGKFSDYAIGSVPADQHPQLWDAAEPAFDGKTAATYDGMIMDGAGGIGGTVQVKVSKADRNGKSKVTATVQLAGEGVKKLTFKVEKGGEWAAGTLSDVVLKTKDGRQLTVRFGEHGLSGSFGGAPLTGSRNFFTAKGEGAAALAADAFAGVIVAAVPRDDGGDWSGWETYSLTVAKKGKVKVSGALANGTKVSATSQMLVGRDDFCIPVVSTRKNAATAFSVWFKKSVTGFVTDGLPEGRVVGRAGLDGAGMPQGNIADGSTFAFDAADMPEAFGSVVVSNKTGALTLPNGVVIRVDGAKKGKWTLPKAGKVALVKGATAPDDVDGEKFGDNPAGLKLGYTAKTGAFKGSFALYRDATKNDKLKLKKLKATVNGVVVDGVGYGSAVIKKTGSMPVAIVK